MWLAAQLFLAYFYIRIVARYSSDKGIRIISIPLGMLFVGKAVLQLAGFGIQKWYLVSMVVAIVLLGVFAYLVSKSVPKVVERKMGRSVAVEFIAVTVSLLAFAFWRLLI